MNQVNELHLLYEKYGDSNSAVDMKFQSKV